MSNRQNSYNNRSHKSNRTRKSSNNEKIVYVQRKGRGHGTDLQREAARFNPWIQAVKRYASDNGVTYKDAMVQLSEINRAKQDRSNQDNKSRRGSKSRK